MLLRPRLRQLERVLENLPDAASVFDPEWRYTFINPAAKRILALRGIDGDRVIGKVVWDEVEQLKGSRFEAEARRAAVAQKVVEYEEYLHARHHEKETRAAGCRASQRSQPRAGLDSRL